MPKVLKLKSTSHEVRYEPGVGLIIPTTSPQIRAILSEFMTGLERSFNGIVKAKATRTKKKKKTTRAKRNVPRKQVATMAKPEKKRKYKRITDPITLERRRAALVRARATLAERRAHAGNGQQAQVPEPQPAAEFVEVP